ncbi:MULTISPECIES: response regulator transcription factor [unclassified Enterococcus]|uniref:response regulator n=1 Tax=unclassified Enterococcus TaxID=2608891 RepID=UPI001552E770|nr:MULTISPECIES: response regulator transcription factor [unclassified Enterococcus]MBS7578034.1 response regulator transcription factor [Enterococcus sp. MMGLQ5-2]MBS7585276.1 response regulator transcription factor [Enterococcus sp. MMGLQ5-1]NPD13133.1 response regulator transcription factor [Enterococcus sp. MMGLQ5-1]NPD37865.1 response regulator transcription factor [Enterococcus sp. MMGLQ5-2]
MIKVLLVDDHPMVRLGVASFLNLQDDIEVVAEADNGLIGYEKAIALRPDIVLMDLVMDVMDGIESTQKILAEWQEAKIVIVTSFIDDEKVIPAIEAGASGYLLKSSSAEEIAQAIRKVFAGEKVLEQPVTDVVLKNMSKKHEKKLHEDLTVREKEVLQLIAKGYSNQEIADELFISLKTVKTHVSNILSKLMVEDRTQVAIYAFKHNLVADD